MKYGELVAFEPIEEIVQLREADKKSEAIRLIKTYVISEGMAKNLQNAVFPQLDHSSALDKKGLFIVGNYGTGKSHLMAVISSIAEDVEMVSYLQNAALQNDAKTIAGSFKIIRLEIGASKKNLRDIICGELEKGLKNFGVTYQFPPFSEVTNNKDFLVEMMGYFHEKYSDKGLLLVVDELLDYLRSRSEGELILDLNFLREIGEVCRLSKFRFMAGIQEALFDNPRFGFVANSIQRVQARFHQVRILKEDVSFVVAERLLRKDAKQKAKIRNHLQKFTPYYGDMNERLEEYVRLFPVHPAYLESFERMYIVEKRDVLKTLSREIKSLIGTKVPEEEPGIISFDSYWNAMKADASLATNPDIKNVLEKGQILEGILQKSFPKPQYRPSAIRIIHALAVHRLTTGEIFAPIGMNSEAIRDELCIFLPIPEKDSEFLRSTVETIMRDISKTVSGQFISSNESNGQYYLDLKKDIDYDAQIIKRSETLDTYKLDHYYFDALARVMERPETTYVPGYRIWEHELIWKERNSGRLGYLFFGAPNQRSTAQPPQDFYIYFIQPFDTPEFTDERKPDEVFFYLVDRPEEFDTALRLYAGAREMASTSGATTKRIYEDKASEYLKTMVKWLREHIFTAFDVVYQGDRRKLVEWAKGAAIPTGADVRETIDKLAASCLAPHFAEIAPDYPKFSQVIRKTDREEAMRDAIKILRGSGLRTQRGIAVLDGLELLEGDTISPDKSKYARYLLKLLQKRGEGQVLNRSDIISNVRGIEFDEKFHVEPELVMVVLAALVYHGDLVIAYPGKKIDPTMLDDLAKMNHDDLIAFKHLEQPRSTPIETLAELFTMLSLTPGLIKNPDTQNEAIKALQTEVTRRLEQLVEIQQKLQNRLTLWSVELLSDQEREQIRSQVDGLKEFLESLQRFNTPGKLRNFPHTKSDIVRQKSGFEAIKELDQLTKFVAEFSPLVAYLSEAEVILPTDNPARVAIGEAKKRFASDLQDSKKRLDREFRTDLTRELERLKQGYIENYFDLHRHARLGVQEDDLKKTLMNDSRLKQLTSLASIEILPKRQLTEFQTMLSANMMTCFSLTDKDLESSTICPYCKFRPMEQLEVKPVNQLIYELNDQLDDLYQDWTSTLLTNLEDPIVKKNIGLLKAQEKKLIQEFIISKSLPADLPSPFLRALQDVFTGLEKVTIKLDDLRKALMEKGSPCTVDDLQNRFEEYVASLMRGKDVKKVRIVVE